MENNAGGAGTPPVAFFIYKRPDLTARVFEAIARAKPPQLLIVADGPKGDDPQLKRQCEEARRVAQQVDWPCKVLTNFSGANLGLKRRVSSGLDWVFSQVPEAIILEDDCLPDISFFRYCSELLARYRDDERVHMVRGANFVQGRRFSSASYYFSRFFHIWGWATWARAWRHYDIDMKRWPELRDSGWLETHLPEEPMARLVRQIFDETHGGKLETWEFQWEFSSWLRNALAIAPACNLVTNIGFGAAATNMREQGHIYADLPAATMRFPLRHPRKVAVLDDADRFEWSRTFPGAVLGKRNLLRRLLSRARHHLSRRADVA